MIVRAALLALLLLAGPAGAQDASGLVRAARAQVGVTVVYDAAYARIPYPGGDVPAGRGVCADVLVRAFRTQGLDLQQLVHEDMARHFDAYPRTWGLRRPDANIDHRRVLNLETYLRRRGFALRGSSATTDFRPGDVVSWRLPGNLPHIGIVSDRQAADGSGRPLVIHNVGRGAREEDALFAWPQAGHYRWAWVPRPADAPSARGPDVPRPRRLAMQGSGAWQRTGLALP